MTAKKKSVEKVILFMGDHARHVCPVVRVIAPAERAVLQVHQGNERVEGGFRLHLDRVPDADLVIMQRDFPADVDAYEQVIQAAREADKRVLYDIDDLLIDLPEEHPDTERYIPGRFPVLRAIAEADAVTVASAALKSALEAFNPRVHLLPNYLPDEIWGSVQPYGPAGEGPVTIGYMGGHSHRPDLDMLEPVLRRLLEEYGEGVRLQFWGIDPPEALIGDPRVAAEHVKYTDYERFAAYFTQQPCDVLIAPLRDSRFNRCKSWLKFLEYSARGIPGVYSDLEPYREVVRPGENGFLASTLDEWYDCLAGLVKDSDLRKTLGATAYEDVRDGYMLSSHAGLWKKTYAQVASGAAPEADRLGLENSMRLAALWQREIEANAAEKEAALHAAREEATSLSGSVQAQQEELESIQRILDDLTAQHNELNALHEEVSKSLAHFEEFSGEQRQKIEAIETELADARRLNQMIPDMQAQLKEKDRRIDDLHGQLRAGNELVAELHGRLLGKDDLIESQEERLSTLEQSIFRQASALDALEIAQAEELKERVRAQSTSGIIRISRLLRFASHLRLRWGYLRLGFLRRMRRLRQLPLFDAEWYLEQHPDVAHAGVNPYAHYLLAGWREGRNPGPFFDVLWYLTTYPDVHAAGIEPLGHYLRYGRWENRRPQPDLPQEAFPIHPSPWLPAQHRPGSSAGGWRSRIAFRWRLIRLNGMLKSGRIAVPPLFDPAWYVAQNPDVAEAGIHPYLHYLIMGWQEGRDPHPHFNVRRYLENYPDVREAGIEPFEHFCTYGWLEGRSPHPEISTAAYFLEHGEEAQVGLASLLALEPDTVRAPTSPPTSRADARLHAGPAAGRLELAWDIESSFPRQETLPTYESQERLPLGEPPVKLIAFYLPQFHPIPENDRFWGPGFTEWTNVVKARPLFEGHYQPRLPGDLGFYDLRVVEVMQRQAEMARAHGIYGFCFHHYWFNGKRVLERPVDQFLSHPEIDVPFCLNWANENWTRRWDGYDEEVLLRQDHSPEDDLAFIADAMRYFKDPRYIQVDDKPLFILYNPQRLPDPQATAERWRAACREAGFDGIYLVAAQTFGFFDPGPIGFDAVVEFPPHNAFTRDDITSKLAYFGDFKGFVADYRQLSENYPMERTDYTLFKTVVPAWDNTARRGLNASVYHGSTPEAYADWLRRAIRATLNHNPPDQRFVFLNAWNEWAEGTYLEPDREYGFAYLNATTRALQNTLVARPKLLFIGHDAFRAGSQIVLLNLLRWLKVHTHYDLRLLLGRGGDLLKDYQAIAPTLLLDEIKDEPLERISAEIRHFCGEDVRLIYANTGVSGWILPYLHEIEAPVITHVHELQSSIEKFVGEDIFALSKAATTRFIAVSNPVKENLVRRHHIEEGKIEVVHPFITDRPEGEGKHTARSRLGLEPDVALVFGCGTLDWRKGPDLFLDVAEDLVRRGREGFHFYWIGKTSDNFSDFEGLIHGRGLEDRVTYLGEKEDPQAYFEAGDIFLLPSREDPYPLVVLEAARAGLPSVCFSRAGGIPAFIGEGDDRCGFAVPFEDVAAMADAVEGLIDDVDLRMRLGGRAREKLIARHTIDVAMPQILNVIRETAGLRPGVSVIVPTYNHAAYLPERLDSIFGQTYRDVEVLILDDASTDETPDILAEYASRPEVRIESNAENSGSTFVQWAKGIENTRGEFIWIAEDDDSSEPTFLEALLPYFEDPDVKLAYTQSYAIDEKGQVLFSYKGYTDDISPERWEESYVASAEEEVNLALAVKNTIPNASAVLFRRFDIEGWADKWRSRRLAGDWALYLHAILGGKIAYHPEHLNRHRRHENTNIHRTRSDKTRVRENLEVHRLALQLYPVDQQSRERIREMEYEIWRSVQAGEARADFDQEFDAIVYGEDQPREHDRMQAQPQVTKSVYERFHHLEDASWYRILVRSLEEPVIDGVRFPPFPEKVTQRESTGREGEFGLYQAFHFYKQVHRFSQLAGQAINSGTAICDFGCGWGRITRFFLKDVPPENIIGLDISELLIDICKDAFCDVRFEVIPEYPPYDSLRDESLDVICAYSVFSHLRPELSVDIFSDFYRILKPNGIVVFTSRGKAFMDHCEALRNQGFHDQNIHEARLTKCFVNLERDKAQYDKGIPVYYQYTDETVVLDSGYGEAAIPPKYFSARFKESYTSLGFELEDAHRHLDQVTIALCKR